MDLPEQVAEAELISKVHELNVDALVHGILVRLPLPKHINKDKILSAISIEKDVDGFHPLNIGKLAMKGRDPLFLLCTLKGCLELLSRSGISIKGMNAVVVGRSNIVGLPVSLLLLKADATVTVVHSCTQNPKKIIREADIVIAAAGQAMMTKGSWIKPGAAVIDVGTNAVDDPTKKVKDALVQFDTALTLDPNPVEAQAAYYNKACCHAYRGEGKKAAECLRIALREYDLKFATILNDPDLASFRALPEFKELQEEAKLGGEDIGYGFRRDLKLISEVQAPFRGVRKFFYFAFTAAAGISLFFTIPMLIRAIQGGDGAPNLLDTAQNAAINLGGIVVFVALFLWDNKKEEEQIAQISRNETLSRLPLRLSTNRIVELVQLRDTVRPVILAGKKETVSLAMRKAERFRTDLIKRGVLLVPVIWGEGNKAPQIEKKGFGVPSKATASLPSIGEDFETRAQSVTAKSKLKAEVRFRAEVVSPAEWERWIKDQQKSEGVAPGEDVYIVLRLDGRVRTSGKGMPDWQQLLMELPPMEALLSKLER